MRTHVVKGHWSMLMSFQKSFFLSALKKLCSSVSEHAAGQWYTFVFMIPWTQSSVSRFKFIIITFHCKCGDAEMTIRYLSHPLFYVTPCCLFFQYIKWLYIINTSERGVSGRLFLCRTTCRRHFLVLLPFFFFKRCQTFYIKSAASIFILYLYGSKCWFSISCRRAVNW